jgi:hypothetical protein
MSYAPDLARSFLGGFESGQRLAERWEETRRIVEEREQRLRAQADYQTVLREKIEPLRAVRQALWADLATTQQEYAEVLRASQAAGAPLPELAQIQGDYSAKLQTHLRAAMEANAAEESAWHEYASVDMTPFRAEQAKRELDRLVSSEKRFTDAVANASGTFSQLYTASLDERKLGLDERQVAAQELSAQASMVNASRAGEGNDLEARRLDLEGRRLDIEEAKLEKGEPPKPLTAKQRSDVLDEIDKGLETMRLAPTPELLGPIAARVREETGLDISAETAAKDAGARQRLLDAERSIRILERGEVLGDESLLRTGAQNIGRIGERVRSEATPQRSSMDEAAKLAKKPVKDLADAELDALEQSARVARSAASSSSGGVFVTAGIADTKEKAKREKAKLRFDAANKLLEKISRERKRRAGGLSPDAERQVDELLGTGE